MYGNTRWVPADVLRLRIQEKEGMTMLYTIILSITMMAGLFLMLWSAVGFIQNKRFFGSAPKVALDIIQPKGERFKGQHAVGWLMMLLSLVLMAGAIILGAYDGILKVFGLWQFFIRFATMMMLLKAFDILVFDWVLLCHSNFFPHYYPELKGVYGPHLFGYNMKSHLPQIALMLLGSLLAAWICTLM